MTTKDVFVDRELVRQTAADTGSMYAHDIDAVEALYPEAFDASATAVSARFAGVSVAPGSRDEARRHLAALVIADLWDKRGRATDPNIDARVQDAKARALEWFASSKTVSERVRLSASPPPYNGPANG